MSEEKEPTGSVTEVVTACDFPSATLEVTPRLTIEFARAVNDYSPWYLDEDRPGGPIAPPMFAIAPAMQIIRGAIASGHFKMQEDRTVHGEQDMHFLSPIRPGDSLVIEGGIVGTGQRATGSTIDIDLRIATRAGIPRVQQRLTLFVKASSTTSDTAAPRRTTRDRVQREMTTATIDQTYRYASASFTEGIRVHEDVDFARSSGYRDVIVQGQCTMAFAAKAIVNLVAEGDPTRLKRFRVRFAHVVYPGDTVTTSVWAADELGRYAVEAASQEGVTVLRHGEAEIRGGHR